LGRCTSAFDPRHAGWIVSVVEIELRDYRIRHGQMDAWIAGWKSGVVPLREKAGFHIIGAWVDRQNDRFVWLVGYAGAGEFETANNRYYSSHERGSLQPDPAELIEEVETVKVETVV
jgi:NIPSNAP